MDTILFPCHDMDVHIHSSMKHRLKLVMSEKAGFGMCTVVKDASNHLIPAPVGCEALVKGFSTEPNGDVNLLIHGGRRFNILKAEPLNGVHGCIRRAQVTWRPSWPVEDKEIDDMRGFLEALYHNANMEDKIDSEKFSDPEWVSWRFWHFNKSLTAQQMLDLLTEDRLIGRMRRHMAALFQVNNPEYEYVAFTEDGRPTGKDEWLTNPHKEVEGST
jgi:Lon protease-like protein